MKKCYARVVNVDIYWSGGYRWIEVGLVSEKRKSLRILVKLFFIIFNAFCFFLFTYVVIWILFGENKFTAYIANGLAIIYVLTEDKIKFYYLKKRKNNLLNNKRRGIIEWFVSGNSIDKWDTTSMKFSLYLFYIVALIASHLITINLHWDVPESIRGYLSIVGYALVILIAFDKFLEQFHKDDKLV